MKVINEVMNESMAAIAQHYAERLQAEGINPTPEQLMEVVADNWDKLSGEIAGVYGKAMAELGA